jgi:hypothetical protein
MQPGQRQGIVRIAGVVRVAGVVHVAAIVHFMYSRRLQIIVSEQCDKEF